MSKTPREKEQSDPYSGMTTNERLSIAGVLDEFNGAEIARDRSKMVELLKLVGFSTSDAEQIADIELS